MTNDPLVAQTSIRMIVSALAKKLREHHWCGAVIGAAGIGKTIACKQLLAQSSGIYFLTLSDALGRAQRDLWIKIANMLIGRSTGTTAETQDTLYDHNFSGELFVFDEAQNVPLKERRELQTLNDRCGMSILFWGNNTILTGGKCAKEGWDQFTSRLALFEQLTGATDDDADAIAAAHGVVGDNAFALVRSICRIGHPRGLVHVLQAARVLAGAAPITVRHIREAVELFPQYRAALSLKPVRSGVA